MTSNGRTGVDWSTNGRIELHQPNRKWHSITVTIVLLTRSGCAACITARATLARICADVHLDFTEVDVDDAAQAGDKTLRAEYGDRLPVVLLDDVEHSYWEVDEPRLRADLGRAGG